MRLLPLLLVAAIPALPLAAQASHEVPVALGEATTKVASGKQAFLDGLHLRVNDLKGGKARVALAWGIGRGFVRTLDRAAANQTPVVVRKTHWRGGETHAVRVGDGAWQVVPAPAAARVKALRGAAARPTR